MTARSLASRLTRSPRVYNVERAADARALVAGFAPELGEMIAAAASTSSYLMSLLEKEVEWLAAAVEDPETALRDNCAAAREFPSDRLADGLRQGKRRMALLTALADLGGAFSLEEVTGALTEYADAACGAALRDGLALQIRRGKLPGMGPEALDDCAGMVVLAMGKMGARELNYSSDIDLICVFDESRFDADDFHAARQAFVRATRAMCATLSDLTAQGYVFRTDLRLRPDPSVTPVCIAMEAAERYYESLGRTWERAAYIKARPAVGDIAAGERFLQSLRPFVWRRHLDFAAIQDAHDMRLAIREHKGLGGPITLPGHDMKLGRGGIREIEFFTQTRQLIAGGRDANLRVRGTLQGLGVLAASDWISDEVAQTLGDHYRAHRTVEHRLQMVQDAQTHALPRSEAEFDRLACMMDMHRAELETDLHERLQTVHDLIESFFAASREEPQAPQPEHRFDTSVLDRWPSYPALRSERGADIFGKLKPLLLNRLAQSAKPDEGLLAFDGFLAGLPAGVQLFSLLRANPQLGELLVDIVATSPALASHLSRNAGVLDAVIGGDFFSDWPGQAELARMLEAELTREADYELRLDATRRWAREWHFRIGVHLLRGLTDAATASVQYADLARAVLQTLWPVVLDQFALRHGPPPGRGAVLLGMGSLGAGRLTPTSDLDMLVIYDAQGAESSEGKRPLATRSYYARLTQAMITAMTAPMAQGKLYDIDMRLRPSGNQGPVATSLASFESYQKEQAWVWEHLALTRAEVIAGPAELAEDVEKLRRDILSLPTPREKVLAEVAQMRVRIAAARSPVGPLDAKTGAGRLQDIELFAQAGALIAGLPAREIEAGLAAARAEGLIDSEAEATLLKTYRAGWTLQCAARLLSDQPPLAERLGQAGVAFLCRVLDCPDPETLERRLRSGYDAAAAHIAAALPKTAASAEGS